MNKPAKILLSLVMLLGTVLMIVFGSRYFTARKELSALKKDLSESTAAWKQTNEEKLVIQKELKEVKNELRDAELTITESEERAQALRQDIEQLEKEIEELKTKLPEP